MNCYFINDLLKCSDEELREIDKTIAEELEARKKLKRQKIFDAFMEALEVMAKNYPDELFEIDCPNGAFVTLDWEDLYKNFVNM